MYQLRQLNVMMSNLFANYWRPLLISLAILMWMWWLFGPTHAAPLAQAPFNNANTYIVNIDAGPISDVVSNVGETFGSVSLLTKNVAYVSLFQDLAAVAKGTIMLTPDGQIVPVAGTTTPTPVPDALLTAVLNKHGVTKVYDATGVQIFP